MQTEPLTGARKPEQSDGPLGGLQISNAIDDLASLLNARFPTTSDRDAAWTAWSTATGKSIPNGAVSWCDNPGYFYDRTGGAWVPRRTPNLISAFGPVYGTLPTSFLPLEQAGTASLTTNASALGQFTWLEPFPAGVLTVQLTSMTDEYPQVRLVGSGGTTTAHCQFVARGPTGAPAVNSIVTVSYDAKGW